MASEQQASNLVTSENLLEFQTARLNIADRSVPEAEAIADAPEADVEAAEGDETEAEHDEQQEHKKPNPKLQKRFSELTKARDEARQKAADAERKALEAEDRAKAIEAKYTIKPEDDKEPDPTQYTDIGKYRDDLKEWATRDTKRQMEREAAETKARTEQETRVKTWQGRLEATKKELVDFDAVVSGSSVAVSDQVRDAILESELGPKILYHLAQNPDVADELSRLSVPSALRKLGKLEAQLENAPKPSTPIAQMSKAPAPISPVRGGKASPEAPIDADGEFSGTPAQYRALRRAGKIR
jgi:hypothetical protein